MQEPAQAVAKPLFDPARMRHHPLISDMAERGASRTEKLILLACIIRSGITAPLGQAGLPTGTVLRLAMFWLSATRALSAGRAPAGAPPLRTEAAATA